MARPKLSKSKPAKPKKKAPASTPEITDFQPPFTGTEHEAHDAGGPLEEGETPRAKKVPKGNEGPCQNCQQTSVSKVPLPHDGMMHYGSPERWCNGSGCRCQAYRP